MKAITFNIKGIKCDSPICGWKDMSVEFDPDKFLNMPCPQCGWNLFTQADYNTMKRMFRVARIINFFCWPYMFIRGRREKNVKLDIRMNGSGTPDVKVIKDV